MLSCCYATRRNVIATRCIGQMSMMSSFLYEPLALKTYEANILA